MACSTCANSSKAIQHSTNSSLNSPPYKADDIFVLEDNKIRRFNSSDWSKNRHKLLLFFPETFTPVCGSEMGSLNKWIPSFTSQDCDVFAVTTDPIHAVQDWYENEEALKDPNYRVLSSYLLTSRLGVMRNGKAKRSNVFISNTGEVVIQEYPSKVGRSFEELHRMIYAYNTGSFCAENWKSPEDGFLNEKSNSL